MRLKSGVILGIPLLCNLGYTYAKYIDLTSICDHPSFPEAIKVYRTRTPTLVEASSLKLDSYLLSPMLVAGIRPTLRTGVWSKVGMLPLLKEDFEPPSFKGGNSTYEEIEKGEWFMYRNASLSDRIECTYEQVKFLQPFEGFGTGNVEIYLTMYFMLLQKLEISDYFDMKSPEYQWSYRQIQDTPMLPQ